MSLSIGLNLFTVKDEANRNFSKTMQKVKEFGYEGVEISGIEGISAKEIGKCLDGYGLEAIGKHASYQELYESLDGKISDCLDIGCKCLICSWKTYDTKDDFFRAAEFFNKVGERASKSGLSFAYHGHNHELKMYNGEYGEDILFANTDLKYFVNEIDIYWVWYAGVDPVEFIRKYKGRCPLLHLKDMKDELSKEYDEVGEGIIDIAACLKQSIKDGCKYFIVEQDKCSRPSLESIKISIDNIRKIESCFIHH